jgi:hypothetical protein
VVFICSPRNSSSVFVLALRNDNNDNNSCLLRLVISVNVAECIHCLINCTRIRGKIILRCSLYLQLNESSLAQFYDSCVLWKDDRELAAKYVLIIAAIVIIIIIIIIITIVTVKIIVVACA